MSKLERKCDKYTFDEARHKHYINGKEVTGTTSIVGVIDKPALIPWALNQAFDKFKKFKFDPQKIDEAKKAPNEKKMEAAHFGTIVHALCEHFNKTGDLVSATDPILPQEILELTKEFTPKELEKGEKLVKQFTEWFQKNNAKVLYVEQNVFSETHFIGGIFDLVIEMGGKTYLLDFKTSSGVYPSQFIQMGGYDLQLEEMMERGYIEDFAVDGYIVIHLPRKGKMTPHIKEDTGLYKRAFRACLYIYRLINDQLWAIRT